MAPREIKHLFTEKGYVISAIAIHGVTTLQEIDSIVSEIAPEYWTDLHILLGELIQEGDVFQKETGEYEVRPELEADYQYYEEHIDEWPDPPGACRVDPGT